MGHYLFTKLLMPTLVKTAATAKDPVRIVNLSSDGHAMAPKGGILFDNIDQPTSGTMFGTPPLYLSRYFRHNL